MTEITWGEPPEEAQPRNTRGTGFAAFAAALYANPEKWARWHRPVARQREYSLKAALKADYPYTTFECRVQPAEQGKSILWFRAVPQ